MYSVRGTHGVRNGVVSGLNANASKTKIETDDRFGLREGDAGENIHYQISVLDFWPVWERFPPQRVVGHAVRGHCSSSIWNDPFHGPNGAHEPLR